jgi:uncharacterized protein
MTRFADRPAALGKVRRFDYPYQLAGRRSPDRLPALVAAHRTELEKMEKHVPVVLIGKSMGGRVGCHLANQVGPDGVLAVICLGYPLVGQNGSLRDEVLLAMRTPILFVQGSRDRLCPLDHLAAVRARMSAANQLHVALGGNHSLELTKAALQAAGTTQDAIDAAVVQRISEFLKALSPT